ncbi:sensor histidine kinase [Zavarzinia sp. CC-PAN008]|uniref:sensor histidine kinase n=1 Tax=Zavarzinia sp. CC-PAN008 TaxID=3243332 RepID=UPI003F744D7F
MRNGVEAAGDWAGDGGDRLANGHLRRAEREIAWLRWIGLALWAALLSRGDQAIQPAAWWIYAGGVLYAALAQWRLQSGRTPVMGVAWLTTLGDPVLAAAMCAVSGGLDSQFFPFLHFTLLAGAFRFGGRVTLGLLGLTVALAVGLDLATGGPTDVARLLVALFYLGFSAALGVMLAHWAQENLDLARDRSTALAAARNRTQALLRRLIDAQEDERRAIADDLHDRLGGALFTMQQGLDRWAGDPALGAGAQAALRGLACQARACTDDIRTVMNALRPSVLDDLGFCAALGEHVAALSDQVPFRLRLEIDPALKAWRGPDDALLFRVVQEALLNTRKHAQATEVSIRFRQDPAGTMLSIADDGVGFEVGAAPPRGHFGLLTMKERADSIGARLVVDSQPGSGTRITLALPRRHPA